MNIKLNFINKTNDCVNSEYVLFQKNIDTSFDELHIAWKVIKNCGQGNYHPFDYPMMMDISTSDSDGNYTPKIPATIGDSYDVVMEDSGHELVRSNTTSSAKEIQIRNKLTLGAINALCYKDGKLLAKKTSIAPEQKAVFEFLPSIWIGAASQIVEGKEMNSAVISDINTEISLLGISSADIVATGGGSGNQSQPIHFSLENIIRV